MAEHAAECRQCAETVGWLRRLVAAAVAEAEYYVPEHSVHMARAMFALQRPEQVHVLPRMNNPSSEKRAGWGPRVLAQLVFDSFREPAVAGVRSQQRITRQALYEAGEYSVDLRMEQERGARSVVLVGQIANRMRPEKSVADVPVVLMSGPDVVGRAKSNEFGEFQMEYAPRQPLSLYVPVEGAGPEIEVRLKDLAGDAKGRGKRAAKEDGRG
jgi:hypothetical protein